MPVWGFATVVQSLHPGVAVGEQLYGYWPMANQAVLQPDRLTASGFSDAAPHRAATARRSTTSTCAAAPTRSTAPGSEDVQALLRPLFITSWLIDDFLADNDFFGAGTVLLSSASSKTAYGTAFQLHPATGHRGGRPDLAGNRAFCESLGCYSRVLSLRPARPAARRYALRVHRLRRQCAIAAQHPHPLWQPQVQLLDRRHPRGPAGRREGLAGAAPTLFFAPAQVKKRQSRLGSRGIGQAAGPGLARLQRQGLQWRCALAPGAAPPRRRSGAGRVCAGAGGPGRSAPGAHPFTRLSWAATIGGMSSHPYEHSRPTSCWTRWPASACTATAGCWR